MVYLIVCKVWCIIAQTFHWKPLEILMRMRTWLFLCYSCIDCGVSFPGDDYKAHTQCVSEAEKYQKSLYKGKKTVPAKPSEQKAEASDTKQAPSKKRKREENDDI